MKKRLQKKIISLLLSFNLVLQSFTPFLITPVYADDSTPSATVQEPTPEITPEPTPTPTPSLEITPTAEITPSLEITPTPTVEPTPEITPEPTPTPTIELTPSIEPTPTESPEITPEPSPNTDSQAPPQTSDQQDSSNDSSTSTETQSEPTPEITPTPTPTIPESITIFSKLEQAITPESTPTLTSDKTDYFPTDTAHISGTGFLANTTYTLHIKSSDMPMVSYKVEVSSDENGNFSYAYQLDGNYRPNYSIDALDASGAIVASMTFTDSVTVTPATGGTNIPSDKATNGTSPAFTTLGDIVIDEAANGDFAASQTGGTLILTAPGGWAFNAGVGSVSHQSGRDITSSSVSITTSTVTITFSTDSPANKDDILTISGLQVQAADQAIIPAAGNILRTSGNPGTGTITGITVDSTNFGSLSQAATATPLSFDCTVDTQGANDEPGQKDLSQMCIDDSGLPNSILVNWNWDQTGFTGANTGDACSLYDTDGDGNANYSMCVGVTDTPAVFSYEVLYSCGDDSANRCTSPIAPLTITGNTSCSSTIDNTDPFPAGDSYPDDAVASCEIDMNDIGEDINATTLIDVCSYPSGQPNSDPSDCIIFAPKTGKLEVVKNLIPSDNPGKFNLQINGVTDPNAIDVGDGGSTGEEVLTTGANGTVYTVGETAGTGTDLADYSSSIECREGNGLGNIVFSSNNSGPLNVTLNEDDDIVCTITNTLQNGTIVVHKDVQGPVGEDIVDTSQNFTIQLDGANSQNVTDNGTVTYNDILAGVHTITESTIPAGYILYSMTPDSDGSTAGAQVTVVAGQTTDVYVTNRIEAQPSLTTVKTKSDETPDEIFVGDNVYYEVVVENTGNVTLYNPVVTDYFETENVDYVGSSPTNAVTVNEDIGEDVNDFDNDGNITEHIGVVIWQIPEDLSPEESYTIEFYFISTGMTVDGSSEELVSNGLFTTVCTENVDVCSEEDTLTTPYSYAGVDIDALGSVSGYKFIDENGDGLWVNEASMSGVTVNLYGTDEEPDTLVGSDVTDANGAYSFANLTTGNYKVCEVVPTGYAQTFPGGDGCHTFSVTDNGDVFENKNFGNRGNLTISGLKLEDEDGNVNTTEDQTVLSGWVIELWQWATDAFVNTSITDTTDENGLFSFENLVPGLYQLREQLQAGWAKLFPTGDGIDVTLTNENDTEGNDFVNTQYGTIIVEKQTDPDGDTQVFDFDLSYGDNDADLSDGQSDNSGDLLPGTYSVSENTPAGWDLTSATCDDESDPSSISLSSGETVTCTFNNQKDSSIVVFKQTDPDGSTENFEFNASYHNENFLLTDGFADLSGDLAPGTYSVEELPEAGWDLTSATCDDGSDPSSISLQAGEDVTCTFTNTKKGHIIVDKVTNPAGSLQSFNFDATGSAYTDFSLTDEAAPNDQALEPGTYGISETVPAGWSLTNTTCISSLRDTENAASLELDPGETITCTFTNTELGNITVVKYNDHDGDGIKDEGDETLGDTGVGEEVEATRWEMHLVGTDVNSYQWTGAQVQGQVTFSDLLPNSFTLSEQIKTGWVQTNISCSDEQGIDNDNSHSVNLTAGQDITCYVGNQGRGDVTVYKNVDTDNDGTVDVYNSDDWLYELNTADHVMGTTTNIAAGSYVLDEFQNTGYHFVSLYCDDIDQEGAQTTVDVTPGDNIVCTYTNARDTGTITVNKIIDVDGDLETEDDQYAGENWEFTVEGQDEDTNDSTTDTTDNTGSVTFSSLKTGSYNVTESTQDGYDLVLAECGVENGSQDGNTVYSVNVDKESSVSCNFYNTPNGTIHGYKWNDVDGDGQVSFQEEKLSGWTIKLYESNGEGFDEEPVQEMETDSSEEHFGWFWFEHLTPGEYKVCEEQQDGWSQTYPLNPTCHTMTLPDQNSSGFNETQNAVYGPEYNFGNQFVEPSLEITKSNNAAGVLAAGNTVEYSIRVEVNENNINDLTVTDLPPEGFTYKVGSWKVFKNGTEIFTVVEPVYHSPGVWNLGDAEVDDVFELVYLADISSSQDPGTYKDLAWAKGTSPIDESTTYLATVPEGDDSYVADIFAGTEVTIDKDLVASAPVNVTLEGQVLGASTSLPATGANEIWLGLAALLISLGSASLYYGMKKNKNA